MQDTNFRRNLNRTAEKRKRDVEICTYYITFDENKSRVAQELGVDRETVTRVIEKCLVRDEETGNIYFKLT